MSNLREKGITLIALAVTVIILLILAGVTISQISGNNGLFSKVKQAVGKYKNASLDEELAIGEIERYLEGFNITEKEEGVLIDIKPHLTVSQKTIKVDVEVIGGEVSKVEYKLSTREEWETNKEDEKSLTYTFGNLTVGSYYVKVRAYDKNGKCIEATTETATISELTTAQEKDVLEGKTYIAEDGSIKTGNMINHGTVEEEIEAGDHYEIKEGYYAGGTITSKGGTGGSGPTGKTLVTSVRTTDHGTVKAEDRLGNPVTVPGQFKVVRGEIVEDGIVIEDADGNQFVWIPVSNIDESSKDLITLQNGSKVEITLGRYTFNSNGTPSLKQKGLDCSSDDANLAIGSSKENTSIDRTGKGAGAKELGKFVESVKNNHGYYLGRYEASFGSGTDKENYKPQVKVSTDKSDSKMNYTSGVLWNFINQVDASKISQNMYNTDDIDVVSDLVNSYAWDTAIVYIEKMKHNNYANFNRDSNKNTELKNTGDTGDEVCNIYDMAGNLSEWTTEYSEGVAAGVPYPCIFRGGDYMYNSFSVATRNGSTTTSASGNGRFSSNYIYKITLNYRKIYIPSYDKIKNHKEVYF